MLFCILPSNAQTDSWSGREYVSGAIEISHPAQVFCNHSTELHSRFLYIFHCLLTCKRNPLLAMSIREKTHTEFGSHTSILFVLWLPYFSMAETVCYAVLSVACVAHGCLECVSLKGEWAVENLEWSWSEWLQDTWAGRDISIGYLFLLEYHISLATCANGLIFINAEYFHWN